MKSSYLRPIILPAICGAALGAISLSANAQVATNAVPHWESTAAAGLTLTRGNSDTTLFNANMLADRKWGDSELKLGANGDYGTSSGTENNEDLRAFGQYNYSFATNWYGYGRIEGFHDGIARIDYRLSVSPGLGYYFIKTDKTTLSAEVGPGFVYEKLAGNYKRYATLRIAETFTQKITDTAKIWENCEILPQVDRWGNYVVNSEIGIESSITKSLSLRSFIDDYYYNEPSPGRKKNDVKIVTGIAYNF